MARSIEQRGDKASTAKRQSDGDHMKRESDGEYMKRGSVGVSLEDLTFNVERERTA